jgi:hypothetical protein
VSDGPGKPAVALCLEWGVWVAVAAVGYWLTFDFDEPLDVYQFGASGWPRFILACIVVGATVQAALALTRLRRRARRPLGERAEAREVADAGAEAPAGPAFSALMLGIFVLPLIYLLLLPRTGFYLTTPLFVLAFLWILQVRRPRVLLGVTTVAYGLVLLVFVRLFYVALPVGNWPVFYDVNNWIVVVVRSVFAGA